MSHFAFFTPKISVIHTLLVMVNVAPCTLDREGKDTAGAGRQRGDPGVDRELVLPGGSDGRGDRTGRGAGPRRVAGADGDGRRKLRFSPLRPGP